MTPHIDDIMVNVGTLRLSEMKMTPDNTYAGARIDISRDAGEWRSGVVISTEQYTRSDWRATGPVSMIKVRVRLDDIAGPVNRAFIDASRSLQDYPETSVEMMWRLRPGELKIASTSAGPTSASAP